MPIHSQGLGGEEPIHDKDLQNTNNDKIINTIMLTDQPDKDLQNTNNDKIINTIILTDQPHKRSPTRKGCLPQRT